MHIYFSGIGGTGIGPLALVCQQAGFEVSGSDMQQSQYTDYLLEKGVNLHIGQDEQQIAKVHAQKPIDWIVFSSAVFIDNPDHPEALFAKQNNIKTSKRDECLNMVLKSKGLKLIAIAGTHGKTTATAMMIWLFKQLNIPVSYSVGAKLNFGTMGQYLPASKFFVYECDEFDRNFLSFEPYISIITAVDWDHHEIYPARQDYIDAFNKFITQSQNTIVFNKDASYLGLKADDNIKIIDDQSNDVNSIKLAGLHNRQNAFVCVQAMKLVNDSPDELIVDAVNGFPGTSRRFERLAPNIFSDYAHTPEEIKAVMQLASEVSDNIVVAYEPLTDRRQHFMKNQYKDVFGQAKKVYWLPSYLAREDPDSPVLSPQELINCLDNPDIAEPAKKDQQLMNDLKIAAQKGSLVLCIAGGGGSSLDEWARQKLVN